MYYNDYNNDSRHNGSGDQPIDVHYTIGGEPPRPAKRSRRGIRLVALCLVCALLGGVVGAGSVMAANGGFARGRTTLYEGTHTPTVVSVSNAESNTPLTIPQVYASNVGSVVGINVGITTNVWGRETTTPASGSGFVISEDGYILTNHHVIKGASTIEVNFIDGASYSARLVGGEEGNDIAVLKIDAAGLSPVVTGDSDALVVGEQVVAIGNPLGELTYTLTGGYVSALDRNITMSDGTVMNMLQTDTAINAGNSGGPLFNLYGQVIGITTAKLSNSASSAASIEGLGFAIPINDVKDMVTDIIEHGYVTGKPFLGIQIANVADSVQRYGVPAGAEVTVVVPDHCADQAGLQVGDIVTAVDGTAVTSAGTLTSVLGGYRAGDTVELSLYREGRTLTLRVTLEEETAERAADRDAYIEAQQSQQEQDSFYNYGEDPFGFFGWR